MMEQHAMSNKLDATTTPAKLLSYREAGKILGCSEKTVWTMVNTGQIPACRFGRLVRIDPQDLQLFIERSKTPAAIKSCLQSS